MQFKNLIWDFDGTLFNTYPQMVSAFVKALKKLGIEDIDIDPDEIYEQMRIHSLDSTLNLFSARLGLNKDLLRNQYKNFEIDLINISMPFSEIETILKQVSTLNGKNMLLTHRDQKAIELLKEFNLEEYFSDFVTGNSNFERKPNPESINYLIKNNQVNRDETVMVGDRLLDVRAGENANIKTILFDPDYLIDVTGNPDLIIQNFSKLKEYI